jgi:hypothetical protein
VTDRAAFDSKREWQTLRIGTRNNAKSNATAETTGAPANACAGAFAA